MADAEPNSSAHSYEVLGKLAEGGTTEIFLARAKGAGAVERVVVLKRLKRAVTSHVDLIQLFLDEARLAAQLQHPNIAQVFEVGKLGGSFFFAMEFVNGETLQSLMHHARSKKIQIPVRAVLTIAAAVAAGLHHAHDRKGSDGQPLGIVHGDVSPTNTLVSQEGIVKLVDFGVAKAGQTLGKITPYSSPEQCRGDVLDRRSDLFALGTVLWELLTLDPLYQRANDDDIKQAIEHEEPVRPSTMRYDVPPELDTMVLRLLAKDPAQRFQDADEVLASIEALAQKLSILLSTADLSRMMRLWFGTKSEPTVDDTAADAAAPLLINSEAIPADLATAHTAIDDQLDSVRSAAALITARATARSGNTTGRPDRPSVPPELMDNPGENFEQIRDRILARARQKKETKQNQLAGTGVPGDQNHVTSAAVATAPRPSSPTSPFAGVPVSAAASAAASAVSAGAPLAAPSATAPLPTAATSPAGAQLAVLPLISRPATADDRHSRATAQPPLAMNDRHSRTTAQAPIAVIEDAVRRAGIADPIETNGVNGHVSSAADATKTDEPDKVVVDEDLTGSRSASGELGNKGTSGVITRHEAKVSISEEMSAQPDPREAPPATANVASRDGNDWSRAKTRNMAVEDVEDVHNAVTPNPDRADDAADAVAVASSAAAASAGDAAAATPGEAAITERREGSNAHPKPVRDAERDEAKAARVAARDEAKAVRDHARADRDQAKTDRNEAKAALRRDREDADHTERVLATARASTADIAVRGGRPVWLVPVLAGAALLLALVLVIKLRSGDRPTHANAKSQPTQAQVNESARKPPGHQVGTAADQAAKDQAAKDQAAKDQAAKDQAAKDQAAKDQAAKDQAATDQAAKDQAAKDQAAKDQAAKDQAAKDQAAKDQAAKDQAAKDQAAKDQAAKDQAAKDRNANKDQVAKKDPILKKDPVEKKEPAPKKGIEELFAAGDFATTNTACTKEIVFTPQKLQMCAEAACQTKNTALAKRWLNAISKASRPDMIAKCKGMGVDLEPAPAPAPAPAAPAAPPANESPTPPPTQ